MLNRCSCQDVIGQGYCEKHHCTYQVLSSPDGGCQMCRMEQEGPRLKEMIKEVFDKMTKDKRRKGKS